MGINYTTLGRTGLQVSVIAQHATATFKAKPASLRTRGGLNCPKVNVLFEMAMAIAGLSSSGNADSKYRLEFALTHSTLCCLNMCMACGSSQGLCRNSKA